MNKHGSSLEDLFKGQRRARVASNAEYAIVEGGPVDAILAAVAARKASLIVIGTLGRRGLARLFVGSTTEGVLRATEIPALVVRPGVRRLRQPSPAEGRFR